MCLCKTWRGLQGVPPLLFNITHAKLGGTPSHWNINSMRPHEPQAPRKQTDLCKTATNQKHIDTTNATLAVGGGLVAHEPPAIGCQAIAFCHCPLPLPKLCPDPRLRAPAGDVAGETHAQPNGGLHKYVAPRVGTEVILLPRKPRSLVVVYSTSMFLTLRLALCNMSIGALTLTSRDGDVCTCP